jgi:hypothetical protein
MSSHCSCTGQKPVPMGRWIEVMETHGELYSVRDSLPQFTVFLTSILRLI